MAGKGNTVSRVTEIITPYAEELGLDIWDVRFAKEGTDWYLRIFIDKEGGISIDDCVDLTHAVTKPLDHEPRIAKRYRSEYRSPGDDKHFEKYVGADVMVRLIRPVNNVRDYAGKLVSYNGGEITLSLADGEELKVNKKDTSYVKLDDFDIKDFEKEMN